MRDDLVGYLLDALEPQERAAFEAQLALDPRLQRDLVVVRRSLEVLACDREPFDPPAGLAQRTCHFVALQSQTTLAPAAAPSNWRMADWVVAAGIFLAASMLFFPAVYHSRYAAQLAGCQNNLRRISRALAEYSGLHDGYFPDLAPRGKLTGGQLAQPEKLAPRDKNSPLAAAGVYAVKLKDEGLVEEPEWFVCPGSPLAASSTPFRIPALAELENATHNRLSQLEQSMGGSYGYNLGYVSPDGQYHATKDLRRKNFALLADAPQGDASHPYSLNHGGAGQNVLFEDGHADYLKSSKAQGTPDDIFLNDQGRIAPGVHQDDAVIGPSAAHPVFTPFAPGGGR